jgi:hypothetical protein
MHLETPDAWRAAHPVHEIEARDEFPAGCRKNVGAAPDYFLQ